MALFSNIIRQKRVLDAGKFFPSSHVWMTVPLFTEKSFISSNFQFDETNKYNERYSCPTIISLCIPNPGLKQLEPTKFALPLQCSTSWAIKATWERSFVGFSGRNTRFKYRSSVVWILFRAWNFFQVNFPVVLWLHLYLSSCLHKENYLNMHFSLNGTMCLYLNQAYSNNPYNDSF